MSQPFSNSSWQAYTPAFRHDAHQLLALGYQDALPKIHCACDEPEIDGYIAEAIEDILNDPCRPNAKRYERYSIKPQHPVRGEGRVGISKRKLDIVIELTIHPRANYIFESKILKYRNHPMKTYVGSEGLGRFITGTAYATGLPEAAMIAYIQNRQAHEWRAELEGAISPVQLEKSDTVKDLNNCWYSQHQRADGTTIEIHHIFLDCTAISK